MPRFYYEAKTHLAAVFADEPGQTNDSPNDLRGMQPEVVPFPGQRHDGSAADKRPWRLLEERRLDPHRSAVGTYRRTTDFRVSSTDPDAAPMRTGSGTALGYHDHYVVDGSKARIILATLITPADVMENVPLQDLLWRVCFRRKLRPRQVTGDTTYGTTENIVAVEEAGIRACVPLPDFDGRTPFFGKGEFAYDADHDAYRCSGSELLLFRKHKNTERVRVYQAAAATCNAVKWIKVRAIFPFHLFAATGDIVARLNSVDGTSVQTTIVLGNEH